MKLCRVLWLDAESLDETWVNMDEIKDFEKKSSLAESVGWLVLETEDYLILAGDTDINYEGELYGRVFKIPVKMVRRIEYLQNIR